MRIIISEKKQKLSGIYKISDPVTKKFYIGSTKNFLDRFKSHEYDLKGNRHHNRRLQFIFNKSKDLIFEIVEICDKKTLIITEQKHLDNVYNDPLCINSVSIAGRAPTHNELPIDIQKQKIEKSNQTKIERYGHPFYVSPESREKSAKKRRNIKRDPAIAKKMIETKRKNNTLHVPHLKKRGVKNPNHSKIMKQKYKEGKLTGLIPGERHGTNNPACKPPVTMKNISTGEVKTLYRFEWVSKMGINAPKMSRITNNIQKEVKDKNGDVWVIH